MAEGGRGGAGNQRRTVPHRGTNTPVSAEAEGELTSHTVKGKNFSLRIPKFKFLSFTLTIFTRNLNQKFLSASFSVYLWKISFDIRTGLYKSSCHGLKKKKDCI